MGSLSLRKCVSRDHDKGPRARQLWIHQDIRAVLASRHAGCGGAVPGGARTFHGLCIACAARVDRRLVPETQTSIKPASGSPKTCQEARCCPRRRWQWWGCTQPPRPLLQPSSPPYDPPDRMWAHGAPLGDTLVQEITPLHLAAATQRSSSAAQRTLRDARFRSPHSFAHNFAVFRRWLSCHPSFAALALGQGRASTSQPADTGPSSWSSQMSSTLHLARLIDVLLRKDTYSVLRTE